MTQYLNQIEPHGLVEAFIKEPPVGFTSFRTSCGTPGFSMNFDLLTTMQKNIKELLRPIQGLLFRPKAMFIGTTVTEYSIFPTGVDASLFINEVFSDFLKSHAQVLIVKDVPYRSPILSEDENYFSDALKDKLRAMGFTIVYGQVLAYVPIEAGTIDDYLKTFSKSRRKDLKRKLRSRELLSIELLHTGSSVFNDKLIDVLYGLYLNVYENSAVQFDKLTKSFFTMILKDESTDQSHSLQFLPAPGHSWSLGGIVFLYRYGERIIGFNLCFVYKNLFVDKYLGFLYPDSRRFNLYFVTWLKNIEYCIENNLKYYVAGCANPEVKALLGAQLTHSHHAVYFKNPLLRFIVGKLGYLFESDRYLVEKMRK
ncbi:MAG: GNAT family N-acetyltransferase [Nitrospirae bacterium]|nr:GNAT family N-acetyltransferase [Nitrospirota bacterium]MBF0592543.1 GNAT family N-acetyltransferase [Nitrospirota bacterium]